MLASVSFILFSVASKLTMMVNSLVSLLLSLTFLLAGTLALEKPESIFSRDQTNDRELLFSFGEMSCRHDLRKCLSRDKSHQLSLDGE